MVVISPFPKYKAIMYLSNYVNISIGVYETELNW